MNKFFKHSLIYGLLFASLNGVAKEQDYKITLYNVPYSVLGVNQTDPRFNQQAKMYFALNEKGYFPLMNMLISSENRNPFTATQILAGFAYVNKWDLNNKNNVAILNQFAGTSFVYDKDDLSVNLPAYLMANKQYLVGSYLTLKSLDEWIKRSPDDGEKRISSSLKTLHEAFLHLAKAKVQANEQTEAIYREIYDKALSDLPKELRGNIDIQYYFQAILFKDELLRQITEVAIVNTLNPDEIGTVNFVADVLIKSMEENKLPFLINSAVKFERNQNIQYQEVDFTGDYERVYSDNETLAKQLGLGRAIQMKPTENTKARSYDISWFNGNDAAIFKGQFNPNGRGLDFISTFGNLKEQTDYYVALNGDTLTVYAQPEYGDEYRYVFKKVNKLPAYTPTFNFNQYDLKKETNEAVNVDYAQPYQIGLAWQEITGKDNFYISAVDAANAKNYWDNHKIYGFQPSTEHCQKNSADTLCYDNPENVTVFINSFAPDFKSTYRYCDDYMVNRISTIKYPLSKGVMGNLYLSTENKGNNFDAQSYLAFKVPFMHQGKQDSLCVVTMAQQDTEKSLQNLVSYSNTILNKLMTSDNKGNKDEKTQ